ncbi:MAG: ATP-grasp domain-containing protein [Bryobacterales bacterium]|nr:ATP-grasp domain-containing protein [Bryobacterales bacterium]
MTLLALASYEKGHDFLREAKRQGARVLLLTSHSLQHEAQWPRESIDEIFYMPDHNKQWDSAQVLAAVSYVARREHIQRIVPLDDFDLETAAKLREHLRVPGMGETTTRYFRDKLAMRMRAHEAGIAVPDFVGVLNDNAANDFLERVPAPWLLKPRSMAGAIGIRKIHSKEEFWSWSDTLGDERSHYLLEQFVPGDICHVDSIVYENELLFACASAYGRPPLEVSHEGGIFTTRSVEYGSALEQVLLEANARVLPALGLLRGVSHTEFIRAHDTGRIYFLETAARVGGAHVADMVAAGTGINLWEEWAKLEVAGGKAPYSVPQHRMEHAGLLVSLARQEWPDTSHFNEPELVWRMQKRYHVGLLFQSPSHERVSQLLADYTLRVRDEFHASAPPKDRPTD